MSPLIVIVADDLTGAADCGVACAVAGLDTVVVLGQASAANGLAAQAIAFDADTRNETPEGAAAATARAVHHWCGDGKVRVLYKKMDSTLRGNFAMEIRGARQAHAELRERHGAAALPSLVIVAPAFPAAGRTVRGGRMFVQGIPLEKTEIWRRDMPSGVADVPALLTAHAGLSAFTVPLESIRAGVPSATAALARQAARGVHAVACDAETDDDLRVIAQAAAQLDTVPIFAGSAGLARHLPSAFGLTSQRGTAGEPVRLRPVEQWPHPPRLDQPFGGGMDPDSAPLLFVVGSMSDVSREQLAHLASDTGVQVVTVPPAALHAGAEATEWQASARRVDEALQTGHDVAIAIGLTEAANHAEGAALSQALAQFAAPLTSRIGGLFCTGGETARALFNAVGLVGIRLIGEVDPGVPLGRGEGRLAGLPIVTKAGAFGHLHTLVRCRASLRALLRPANVRRDLP